MLNRDGTLHVTVAISHADGGAIGILLPGYRHRIIVTADSDEKRGHRLHGALSWLLTQPEPGEAPE